jgi:molecular chaperone DnaJ
MLENYYDILGVSRNASVDEIKKAYRKIAMKYHPDKKPGNKVAEEMFGEATKAYEILKDPEKRKKYNSQFSWAQPKTKTERPKRKGTDLRINVKVRRAELIRGAERLIVTKRKGLCKKCEGTGSLERKTKKCVYCNGTGLQGFSLALGERKKCQYCKGAGKTPAGLPCFDCKGTALTNEIIRRKITLHPLMASSTVLVGLGNCCFGGIAGELFIDLDIIEDPNYKVEWLDIKGKVRISPAQAVLGDSVKLVVFDKDITVEIPPGTRNGHIIEMKNAGITYEGKTGYFKAIVYINIPLILSKEEKELYQKLLQIEKEKVGTRLNSLCRH